MSLGVFTIHDQARGPNKNEEKKHKNRPTHRETVTRRDHYAISLV